MGNLPLNTIYLFLNDFFSHIPYSFFLFSLLSTLLPSSLSTFLRHFHYSIHHNLGSTTQNCSCNDLLSVQPKGPVYSSLQPLITCKHLPFWTSRVLLLLVFSFSPCSYFITFAMFLLFHLPLKDRCLTEFHLFICIC